jgi:hypothetical protein
MEETGDVRKQPNAMSALMITSGARMQAAYEMAGKMQLGSGGILLNLM